MKKIFYLISITLLLMSCKHLELKNTTISVSGISRDIFRNINSPNVKIVLYEQHFENVFPYHSYGIKVDSTVSDANGKFKLKYEVKKDISHFIIVSNNTIDNKHYKIEIINKDEFETYDDRIYVEPGEEYKININAYKPNILKVNASVQNNTSHALSSYASYRGNIPFDWDRQVVIRSENIDTIYYLTARPDADMTIYFRYYKSASACSSHYKLVNLHTNTNDTIPVYCTIDCNTF